MVLANFLRRARTKHTQHRAYALLTAGAPFQMRVHHGGGPGRPYRITLIGGPTAGYAFASVLVIAIGDLIPPHMEWREIISPDVWPAGAREWLIARLCISVPDTIQEQADLIYKLNRQGTAEQETNLTTDYPLALTK